MKKFLFEIYENKDRGNVFKGYKIIAEESSQAALLSAQQTYGEDYIICPVYHPL